MHYYALPVFNFDKHSTLVQFLTIGVVESYLPAAHLEALVVLPQKMTRTMCTL